MNKRHVQCIKIKKYKWKRIQELLTPKCAQNYRKIDTQGPFNQIGWLPEINRRKCIPIEFLICNSPNHYIPFPMPPSWFCMIQSNQLCTWYTCGKSGIPFEAE
jgi:hypothetical protein